MKKYTKLPAFIRDIDTLDTIVVELRVDVSNYIISARLIGEGILDDTQVMSDWHSFMDHVVRKVIDNPSLILLLQRDGSSSPIDHTTPQSTYFYIGVKNGYGELTGKVVVDFRLSMHDSTKSGRAARIKHEKESLSTIQKDYPQYDAVEPCKDLIVNNKTFKSYKDAEHAVDGKLQSIVDDYGTNYFPDVE